MGRDEEFEDVPPSAGQASSGPPGSVPPPTEGERASGSKRFYGAVKVGARGQIVLPAEARSDFAIAAGARLLVFGDLEQGLWIAPVDVLQRTMEGTTAFYRMIAPAMGDAGANGRPRSGRNDAGGEADRRGGDVDSMAAKNDADHDRAGGDREGQHGERESGRSGREDRRTAREGRHGEPEDRRGDREDTRHD